MAASDHFPVAGVRFTFSWGTDAIKRARAAGVSVCTAIGSFPSTRDRRRATYSAADNSLPPALQDTVRAGLRVHVGLKGPQLSTLEQDYGLDAHHRIDADFAGLIRRAQLSHGRKRSGPPQPPLAPQQGRSGRHAERLSSAGCCTPAPDMSAAARPHGWSGAGKRQTPWAC